MKAKVKLVLLCALSVVFVAQAANAAVTCVENKTTGKFEERSSNRKSSGECDAQAVMNMVSSVSDVEDLSTADGTKIIGGVIVTNAAKPFTSIPQRAVKPSQPVVVAQGAELSDARKVVPMDLRSGEEIDLRQNGQAAPVVAPKPKWVVEKGQAFHVALETWAKDAGWTFYWYPAKSWKAAGRADMSSQKDVSAAVAEVVSILREEGKAIKLRISEGNNVMEVFSTEVKND